MTLPPKILTPQQRTELRRCQHCEHHVPTQGHHPDCGRPQEARDAR